MSDQKGSDNQPGRSGISFDNNFEILNWVFENRVNQDQLRKILAQLGDGREESGLVKWTSMVLHRVSALMEVTNCMSEAISLNELLPRLMDIITISLDADRSTLFLADPQTGELFSRVAQNSDHSDQINEIRIPHDAGIAGYVYTTGKALIIDDAYQDARFNPAVDKKTGYKTDTILCAPLKKKTGEIIGVSQVLNKSGSVFSADDLSLLESMTRQAASALENAKLIEEVERVQREEAQLLEFFTEISSELKLDNLLDSLISMAVDFLDASQGNLYLYDAGQNILKGRGHSNGVAPDEIISPRDGIIGACFSSGETLHIPDAYEDPRFDQSKDKISGTKTGNILCMPVINKRGAVIGVMQVQNKKRGPFLPTDEKRLKAFCAQGAIALENAQLFEEAVNVKNYNESILRSLSDGVITLDAKDEIIRVNDAACRILKTPASDFLNRHYLDIFNCHTPWMTDAINKVKLTASPELCVDNEVTMVNGGNVSVNLTVTPLVNNNEKTIGSMMIIEDLSREKRIKSTMSRYMTREVAEKLLDGDDEVLGGSLQEATILFTDIRSFTSIAEDLGAKETVRMLNEYFSDMVEVVFNHYGILDKYIGDAIMAVFGAPFSTPVDANNAVSAANAMIRSLQAFNERQKKQNRRCLSMGVGISTGEVIAGNIGSPKRMDYTVIGDDVNLAARLESANKIYGTQILISEFTYAGIADDKMLREIDLITVQGQTRPVAIYEALDFHTEETFPNMGQTLEAFEAGLTYYRNRNWKKALDCFDAALDFNPGDRVSRLFKERCRQCMDVPPASDWDGVWTMTQK